MDSSTIALVPAATWPLPLRTRDTVAVDTPASDATAQMVDRRREGSTLVAAVMIEGS